MDEPNLGMQNRIAVSLLRTPGVFESLPAIFMNLGIPIGDVVNSGPLRDSIGHDGASLDNLIAETLSREHGVLSAGKGELITFEGTEVLTLSKETIPVSYGILIYYGKSVSELDKSKQRNSNHHKLTNAVARNLKGGPNYRVSSHGVGVDSNHIVLYRGDGWDDRSPSLAYVLPINRSQLINVTYEKEGELSKMLAEQGEERIRLPVKGSYPMVHVTTEDPANDPYITFSKGMAAIFTLLNGDNAAIPKFPLYAVFYFKGEENSSNEKVMPLKNGGRDSTPQESLAMCLAHSDYQNPHDPLLHRVFGPNLARERVYGGVVPLNLKSTEKEVVSEAGRLMASFIKERVQF